MVASAHLGARRRHITQKGRTITLRRQTAVRPPAYTDLTLTAFVTAYRPDQIHDDLKQGDRRVELLPTGLTFTPAVGDTVLADSQTWHVIGATALYDGSTLLGYTLLVRG